MRGQIADPHLANKARAGRAEDIRGCLSCNQMCWGRRSRAVAQWTRDGARIVSLLDGTQTRVAADSLVLATTNVAEDRVSRASKAVGSTFAQSATAWPRDKRLTPSMMAVRSRWKSEVKDR